MALVGPWDEYQNRALWSPQGSVGEMDRKLSALIFDMDGLMFDTEPLSREAWKRVLADQGFMLTDEQYTKIIGLSRGHANAVLESMFGPDLAADEAYVAKEKLVIELVNETGVPIKSGLHEILKWAEGRSLSQAVASSSDRSRVEFWLDASGLQKRFEVRIGGDEVAAGKPAPDIFIETAARLNVPNTGCVVLEDSIPGVLTALSAGMSVIRVPDALSANSGLTPAGCHEVESLTAAIPILEGLALGTRS